MYIFFFSKKFPSKSKLSTIKNVKYVRGQCLMNICTKFQVDIFKKWLRYDIKHVKNRHFSPHFRT